MLITPQGILHFILNLITILYNTFFFLFPFCLAYELLITFFFFHSFYMHFLFVKIPITIHPVPFFGLMKVTIPIPDLGES